MKDESTDWRDKFMRDLHREWGSNVPTTDLDGILFAEYDDFTPVAIIEYKHSTTTEGAERGNANLKCLLKLANGWRRPLPLIMVHYFPKDRSFRVTPLNAPASAWFGCAAWKSVDLRSATTC